MKHLLKQRFLAVHHGSIDFGVGSRSQKFWKGQESRVTNFGNVGVRVRYFTSDSATLLCHPNQES